MLEGVHPRHQERPVNEALRTALAAKGIDRLDIAANLQVDPKTVERWLSGRLPHPTSRAALAKLLNVDEADLWPPTDEPHARRFGPEIRAVYPHRWAVPRDVWHKLFASADHEIDILVYSGLFLFEDTGILQLLATKADAGTHIRILLGDPDSPAVAQRGQDEGIGDSAAARIRNVQALIKPLVAHNGVEIRLHRTILYTSIFRADDRLLANPHIYGMPASTAPVLHVRRATGTALFSTYLDSFEQAWSTQAI
jgi:transcriptional regulator with XRE-family HTH domain